MNVVLSLAKKDAVLLLRDRTGFVVTFVSPLIYAVFFGFVFGERLGSLSASGVVIVAVDEDRSESSTALIEALRLRPGVKLDMPTRSQALDAFRRGAADALVIIPAGFGEQTDSDGTMDPTMIKVAIKSDLPQLRQLLMGISPESSGANRDVATGAPAVPNNVYAVAFPQGMTWGLLGCTAAFGLSLVVERNRGTLPRLLVAPITRTQVLAGKAGACFATSLVLGLSLFAVSWLVFGVHPRSPGLLAMALFSVATAFVGIMMFLSVWGRTEQAASSIMWGVLLGMSMLGGGMVPRFFMPASLQHLSDLSPIRWAILAMDGAVWKDFTLAQMLTPCGILVAIGLSCFGFGVAKFRWSD